MGCSLHTSLWGALWVWATLGEQEQAMVADKTAPYCRSLWVIEKHWKKTQLGTSLSSYSLCFSPKKQTEQFIDRSLCKWRKDWSHLPANFGSPAAVAAPAHHRAARATHKRPEQWEQWEVETKAGGNIPSLSIPQICEASLQLQKPARWKANSLPH